MKSFQCRMIRMLLRRSGLGRAVGRRFAKGSFKPCSKMALIVRRSKLAWMHILSLRMPPLVSADPFSLSGGVRGSHSHTKTQCKQNGSKLAMLLAFNLAICQATIWFNPNHYFMPQYTSATHSLQRTMTNFASTFANSMFHIIIICSTYRGNNVITIATKACQCSQLH